MPDVKLLFKELLRANNVHIRAIQTMTSPRPRHSSNCPIVLLSNCPIVLRSFQTNMFLGQWCWTIFESNSFRLIISKLSISQNLDRFLCPFRLGRVSSYLSNYVRHPVLPLCLTDLFYNAPAKRFTSIPTGNNFLKLLQFYFLKKTTCI